MTDSWAITKPQVVDTGRDSCYDKEPCEGCSRSMGEVTMGSPFTSMRIRVAKDVLVRQVEDESVLLNLNNGCYFGLDDVGTRMWRLLTESDSVQAAYERALSEFEVAPEVLEQDLHSLIDSLVAQGLIEVSVG